MANQYLTIAEKLLDVERRPMTPVEMIELARSRSMLSDKLIGRTPHQTLKAELSRHVRRLGDSSNFVRTGPGRFYLRRLITEANQVYLAPALVPPAPKERTLVFPTTWFDTYGRFQGINRSWQDFVNALLNSSISEYVDRLDAEQNNGYKQVVTYVLVTRRGAVLAFKRGTFNRVEDLLRGSYCIGFGGHVAESDRTLLDWWNISMVQCAARELAEELTLPDCDAQKVSLLDGIEIIGLLNDDSSEIGRRHLAVVMRYEVSNDEAWDNPLRGEKSITQLQWMHPGGSALPIWSFEAWSQHCLRVFFPHLVYDSTNRPHKLNHQAP
ncbi:MAG: HTH domain-containing protein [Chloroflexota bacterium]|nr:HTH domain-containing protein [Chloroflexota bacterium]